MWLMASVVLAVLHGVATFYALGVMDEVVMNRVAWGQVAPCPECVGYVAVRSCEYLGDLAWIRWPEGPEGPYLVVDCANPMDYEHLDRIGFAVDVDWETAVRHGMRGPVSVEVTIIAGVRGDEWEGLDRPDFEHGRGLWARYIQYLDIEQGVAIATGGHAAVCGGYAGVAGRDVPCPGKQHACDATTCRGTAQGEIGGDHVQRKAILAEQDVLVQCAGAHRHGGQRVRVC